MLDTRGIYHCNEFYAFCVTLRVLGATLLEKCVVSYVASVGVKLKEMWQGACFLLC